MLNIKPPSVSGWLQAGKIPDDKLIRLALEIEQRGIATRQELLPDIWQQVWPDLSPEQSVSAQQ
jgi:hypothetical protein